MYVSSKILLHLSSLLTAVLGRRRKDENKTKIRRRKDEDTKKKRRRVDKDKTRTRKRGKTKNTNYLVAEAPRLHGKTKKKKMLS
jgi:hypothetical protein